MKKLIAIAALCVGMTAAVFAQDGGWASAWKFGLSAEFKTDILRAASAKESARSEVSGNVADVYEFGNYNKGSVSFFPNNYRNNYDGQRLSLSISNSGENYDVGTDITLDGWANKWSGVYDFLTSDFFTGWHARGNAGIFDGYIGSDNYGGWVGRNGSWSGAWNEVARFGVFRANSVTTGADPDDYWKVIMEGRGKEYGYGLINPAFTQSNGFEYDGEWGATFGVGITPVEQFRFALGYKLDDWEKWGDGWEKKSRSFVNTGFILSGRPLDGVSFDLFYAIRGGDANTINPNSGGKWNNTLGAFVGINLIPNLGITIGYTGNFNVYESERDKTEAEDIDANNLQTKSRKVDSTAPYYSGIDIGVNFSGIDKVGLNFTANISFAGVNGTQLDQYFTKFNRGLDEKAVSYTATGGSQYSQYVRTDPSDLSTQKWSDGWFHLAGLVQADLNFIDGVPLTFVVEDKLGVLTSESKIEYKNSDPIPVDKESRKWTTNDFHVSLSASYGVGNASVGIGLGLEVNSTDKSDTRVDGGTALTTTNTSSSSVVTFNIPVTFKVAF